MLVAFVKEYKFVWDLKEQGLVRSFSFSFQEGKQKREFRKGRKGHRTSTYSTFCSGVAEAHAEDKQKQCFVFTVL